MLADRMASGLDVCLGCAETWTVLPGSDAWYVITLRHDANDVIILMF